MKTFLAFLEKRVIGQNTGERIYGRAKKAFDNVADDLTNDLVGKSVELAGGAAGAVPGAIVKGLLGAASDMRRSWREKDVVKKAEEIARRSYSQKALSRDPSLTQRTVDSYLDISDSCLKHLTERDKDQVAARVMEAVKTGSVVSGHAQKIANKILEDRANEMLDAVRQSQTKVVT